MKLKIGNDCSFLIIILLWCLSNAARVQPPQSFQNITVKQGVTEFLLGCSSPTDNSTFIDTVSKAALCIENGVAQVSGRKYRTREELPNTCRALTSVLHCLHPLKADLEKCAGKDETALLDLMEGLCANGGAGIPEFQEGFQCLQQNRQELKSCFERIDEAKYTQSLLRTLRNPCDALSTFVKCTEETLTKCSTTNPSEVMAKFLKEIQSSNQHAYNCFVRDLTKSDEGSNGLNSAAQSLRFGGHYYSFLGFGSFLIFLMICEI